MFWFGGGRWGWLAALLNLAFWIGVIVVAVMLLQREFDRPRGMRFGRRSSALDILEERYARGEIPREEFLERRRILLESEQRGHQPPGQPAAPPRPAQSPPAPHPPVPPPPPGVRPPPAPGDPLGAPTEQLPREPTDPS